MFTNPLVFVTVHRFRPAAHAAVIHVQRQRGRKRVAAPPPPFVAHPAAVPVVRVLVTVVVVLFVVRRGRRHRRQPAAHPDAVDQLPAEGLDRGADAHRGGETHAAGRGLSDTQQAAIDQGRGEIAEKNQKEN